jgi:hypothetical protein
MFGSDENYVVLFLNEVKSLSIDLVLLAPSCVYTTYNINVC